jgi:hypothetical protein
MKLTRTGSIVGAPGKQLGWPQRTINFRRLLILPFRGDRCMPLLFVAMDSPPAKKRHQQYDSSVFASPDREACRLFAEDVLDLMRTSQVWLLIVDRLCVQTNFPVLKQTSGTRVFYVCKHRSVRPDCDAVAAIASVVETEELGGQLEEVERFHVFIPSSLRLLDRVQHNHTNDLTAKGLPVDVHAALVHEI